MTNITKFFGGGAFAPNNPANPPAKLPAPEVQLHNAMVENGMDPPDEILIDGTLRRFGKSKECWYVAFNNMGVPAGKFGNWREGKDFTWKAQLDRESTKAERELIALQIAKAKQLKDTEQAKKEEAVRIAIESILDNCVNAQNDHPYLTRKNIQPHGILVTGDNRLVVPIYNKYGALQSVQYISETGQKRFHTGGKVKGGFLIIGDIQEQHETLFIAEGFATAASIYEATDIPCVAAYSANNIFAVTESMTEMYPQKAITIVADNDESGVGRKYADLAGREYGVAVIMPPSPGDANDYVLAGGDLAALLLKPQDRWIMPFADLIAQPSPVSWLVKGLIPAKGLTLLHGASGSGKTFVVLDWVLHMASSMSQWQEMNIKPCVTMYLAGEGHMGIRGRVAAWVSIYKPPHMTAYLSKSGCDLNTQEGFAKVKTAITDMSQAPDLIVIDTLHRFLEGDENSAKDAKSMLDACSQLMEEYGCAVLIVHHTGVSETSQGRGRGSGAYKAAVESEISVSADKSTKVITVKQVKSRDTEEVPPVHLRLDKVEIPGWLDEDGEQVGSAIVVRAEESEIAPKKNSKLQDAIKLFERAWWKSDVPLYENRPFVSREAFVSFLVENMGIAESTAKKNLRPSGSIMNELLKTETIKPCLSEDGWIAEEKSLVAAMLLSASSK